MRKILLPILTLILFACAPQATIASEVTATLLPPTATIIPTPTLHPQFVLLQDQIADSSERYTLLPDGTIEELTADGGRQTVPGLSVDKNGAMTFQVGDQQMELKLADVSFNDLDGVKIRGYQYGTLEGTWVVATGQVWIEQIGEVEPLDLEMTTEFTIEWEKMPKITWEDVSSGRLRETLLEKWESEGKLTAEYLEANGIYAAKPEDWIESPVHFMGFIAGSYLNVFDYDKTTQVAPFDYEGRPLRSSPEVFELIDKDNGEREGMVATSMVVFERPDKTIGFEPWFYFFHKDAVGPQRDGFEAECLGFETPDPTNNYPVPTITFDPDVGYTPFRTLADWKASGRYKAQGELLRKVISDGYPSPELGKEQLTLGCIEIN